MIDGISQPEKDKKRELNTRMRRKERDVKKRFAEQVQ